MASLRGLRRDYPWDHPAGAMPPLVSGIGHIILPIHDMDLALRFYRGALGFRVVGSPDPIWTVVDAKGVRLTLFLQKDSPRVAMGRDREDSPFFFHVPDFPRAASALEKKGYKVKRSDAHQGIVWDPSGNVLGLHDHRKRKRASVET